MPDDGLEIEARGQVLIVAHASGNNSVFSAKEFLRELKNEPNRNRDLAGLSRLFQRLAEIGKISNEEHFRKVEGKIFEFKKHQCRVLGFFGNTSSGSRAFWLTNGCIKKRGRLPVEDIERAKRIRIEWLNK